MADAVAQRENLAQAQQSGLLGRKRFEVLLSNAKNKHLLALEHLHSFVGSLAHAFQVGSEKAHNPDPSILKIIAGSETITHQDVKFAIDGFKQEDANIVGRGLPYIKNTLYPEDVIGIIEYLRLWLTEYYAKETKEHSWTIQISTLNHEWQNAVDRMGGAGLTNPIADFSQRELQEARQSSACALVRRVRSLRHVQRVLSLLQSHGRPEDDARLQSRSYAAAVQAALRLARQDRPLVGRRRGCPDRRGPRGAQGRVLRFLHRLSAMHGELPLRCRHGGTRGSHAFVAGR